MTKSKNPVEEILKTKTLIERFIKDDIYLFRAPQGKWDSDLTRTVNENLELKKNVGSVRWEFGGKFSGRYKMDWNCWKESLPIEACGRGYLSEILDSKEQNGIVLLHDLHNKTIDLVKWLVPRLKAVGIRFVRADSIPSLALKIKEAGGRPSELIFSPISPSDTVQPRIAMSPFTMAFAAREGRFTSEGIPRGQSFCNRWQAGDIEPKDLLNAASFKGYFLSPADSNLRSVQMQADAACR